MPASVTPPGTGVSSSLVPKSAVVVTRRAATRKGPKVVGTLVMTKLPSAALSTEDAARPSTLMVAPEMGTPLVVWT